MLITDDLQKLLDILPTEICSSLEQHPQRDNLIEVVLDLGRRPEARFPDKAEYLSQTPITQQQLDDCIQRVGTFGGDNRAGIEQTLHRISAIRNRNGKIIGLTCRVGRAIYGTISMIRDLVETGKSILMLGRPGVGKTTALREIARVLADELNKRVVIIDSSNEIAGDGDIPHPAIGRARRMQVARPELQHQVMIEAVENHMPEVIVIDEIGTELEAMAARTIAERGVQLVGTAHGNEIENLIKNPTLSDLVGGIQSVTLGDEEARRRRTQKTVLERKAPPTFEIAVEMLERQRWVVHESVADTVDSLLRGHQPNPQVRTINDLGQVTITREIPSSQHQMQFKESASPDFTRPSQKWRSSGRVIPFREKRDDSSILEEREYSQPFGESHQPNQPMSEDSPLHVYPYGLSRHQLEEVIHQLNLPVVLTRDINDAEVILALRTHARKHSNFQHMLADHQVPVYTIKANTISAITRALRSCLQMDEPDTTDVNELYSRSSGDLEIDALEEARVAVEQVVIKRGQPVELLPRSASVRKMQHELVERYRLKSHSFGEEPHRRLRIYPA
jgi:stage III sporulation protein SpoIIIAA